MKPVNVKKLPLTELVQGSTGEKLSKVASISDTFNLNKLLIHREIVPPGRKTAPIHKHSKKEEAFYIESGSPSLWLDGKIQQLSSGDVVGFTPSDGMRMIFNDTSEDAVVWTIGTNNDGDVIEFL